MITEDPGHWFMGSHPPDPGGAELAELMYLNERFRNHRVFRDLRAEYQVRYLAFAARPDGRPHTIITDDLAELRDELERAASQD
jgi:hypothetical protein